MTRRYACQGVKLRSLSRNELASGLQKKPRADIKKHTRSAEGAPHSSIVLPADAACRAMSLREVYELVGKAGTRRQSNGTSRSRDRVTPDANAPSSMPSRRSPVRRVRAS